MRGRKTWSVRLPIPDMRANGESLVARSEITLRVPGKDPQQAARFLQRLLQDLIDHEAETIEWSEL